jgi:hypothetical protein
MTPQHDILDELKAALEIEPSTSFEARVRRRVASASVTWGTRMRLVQLAATSAAVLGIAAVWFGWARRDDSVQPLLDPAAPIASRAPAAPLVPKRILPAPTTSLSLTPDVQHSQYDVSRATGAPDVQNAAAVFDPFRDVLIPSSEARATGELMERIESGPLPTALQRALAFNHDDVRVVALNELAPIAIAPIGVTSDGDASAGLPR